MIDGDGFFCEVCDEEITEDEAMDQEGMCVDHYERHLERVRNEEQSEDEALIEGWEN
jgi:hypothetical protein